MQPIYVALDLETTGLDTDRDAIIEIGAVKFSGAEVQAEFSTLVNPGRRLPQEIVVLTGIQDDDLVDAPPLQSVLPRLESFVGDHPVVGHNVGFDMSFVRRYSILNTNPSLDTFDLSTILVPGARRYSLTSLAAHLGFPPSTSHRALADAYTTQQLFVALLERAHKLPTKLLEELVKQGERIDWPAARFFRQALREASQRAFEPSFSPDLPKVDSESPLDVGSRPEPLVSMQRAPLDEESLTALLAEEGAFASNFPSYEYREQQIEMLSAVVRAFNKSSHMLVEAPTGVGKSLAYLLPAARWAVQNGERVVISTNTINLQEQLYHKDLPELMQAVDMDLKAAVLKGRSHYLCRARLAAMRRLGPKSIGEMNVLARILVWLLGTKDGDGDALFLPSSSDRAIWLGLSAEFDGCDPERCRTYHKGGCYFYNARKAADAAHLLIVNHALLLADVAVQNKVLPEYHYLIVDEAHHLEAATTRGLSFEVNQGGLRRLLEEVGFARNAGGYSGLLGETIKRCQAAELEREQLNKVERLVAQVARDADRASRGLGEFFDGLDAFVSDLGGEVNSNYSHRVRVIPALRMQPTWDEVEIAWDEIGTPLFAVEAGLEQLAAGMDELVEMGKRDLDDLYVSLLSIVKRLEEMHRHLNAFVSQPNHQTIYWIEAGPGTRPLSLNAAPLHVGPQVEEHLFHKKEAVILTSATLRTGGGFDYLRERLYAWDADEFVVDSPFDYESSAMVYLVDDIPEPGQSGYQQAVSDGMAALFQATRGRALALFTSYSQLRATARAITAPLSRSGITVFAQGQGLSRNQLLESFRTTEQAVLLGTRSFWEGVDVSGEALSCLAIAKLPFNVPSDPVFAARAETFEDAFLEYAVPEAVLRFLQGFGRLIRTRTDRGVVAVFDRRLTTKAYGSVFIDSLPGPTIQRGSVMALPKAAAKWLNDGEAKEP